jgi:hypothetical protein
MALIAIAGKLGIYLLIIVKTHIVGARSKYRVAGKAKW